MCPIPYPLQLCHRLHPRQSPSGLRWGWGWSECLGVWSGLRRHVQAALNRVQAAARGVGMTINASKTKVMPSLVDPVNWQPLTLDGVNLEDMQSFVCLGSTIMPSGQDAAEVDRRIGAARSAFVRLKRSLWGLREISTATKERIYQAIVRTILFYGCETWPLRAVDLRKCWGVPYRWTRPLWHIPTELSSAQSQSQTQSRTQSRFCLSESLPRAVIFLVKLGSGFSRLSLVYVLFAFNIFLITYFCVVS